MAINRAIGTAAASVAEVALDRVRDRGSANHAHLECLASGQSPHLARDLADAVHLLCQLYGRHPGLLERARNAATEPGWRDWLASVSDGFERERLYLVRLTAAVGPQPSTPGAAETEASLVAQRHALETLAGSERQGCALGAITALLADWQALRGLLDRAASRAGVEVPTHSLPDFASLGLAIDRLVPPGGERALGFGAEQLLLQHGGLLDLLEARSEARGDY
jgi:hypothetical protein